jgi:hypothetical protein
MRRRALKLGRKLIPVVKISTDDDFTKYSLPYNENLYRRHDKCNITTYWIREDLSYFRVFITNSSNKSVELFPVLVDSHGKKKVLAGITVLPHQEGQVPAILDKFRDLLETGMEILDADGFMLLDLRFRGALPVDEFHKAVEYHHAISDDEYVSAEEGPPTPRAVSPLAVVPYRNTYFSDIRRMNAFKPHLHHGTRAQFDRMHALLGLQISTMTPTAHKAAL